MSNKIEIPTDLSLEWLELKSIPDNVYNPLIYPINFTPPDPVEEMVELCMDSDYLHFAVKNILNIELPPYQTVILDTLWNRRLPMLIGSRGAAKSFILAVYALTRMVFHPGCKIVIVGAGLRQSKQVYDYMCSIWEKAPILRDIAGNGKTIGPRRLVDRYEFEIGDSVTSAIPIGDGTKIRGLRANYIIADEFASIPEEIFNLVVQGFAVVASSPIEKIKEAAMIRKLKEMGHWSEEMERFRLDNSQGNQIIYSGTAFYSFNHFYKYFKKWHAIISSKGDNERIKDILGDDQQALKGFNWKDYAIIRLPYTHVPEGMLDQGILAQAKATLHRSQFLMEYGAIFATDSDGFYKRSIIEAATTNRPILVPSGDMVQFNSIKYGVKDKTYVMGVDPAADADNAAIVILELHPDHRRVVHCWTTNKKNFDKLKKNYQKDGKEIKDEYYRYIAKKIRSLMREFNIEHIVMDKHGGGTAIAEALSSEDTCAHGEYPVYQIINPDEPKADDIKHGVHILQLLSPTNDINSEANQGMRKDLESKILLFPMFDTVEISKAVELDYFNDIQFDTYEDLVNEIEELKNEMTSIVVTPSASLGKETYDTPQIKGSHDKKGRLRKDRFSALLYANFHSRNKDKEKELIMQYVPVGGTKDSYKKRMEPNDPEGQMYYGIGTARFGKNNGWMRNSTVSYGARKN